MINKSLAKKILSLIDLTSLNEDDNDAVITQLCAQAENQLGTVAAICVYSRFVSLVKKLIRNPNIKIAAVANFPAGNTPIAEVLLEIKNSIGAGANEIDVVMPYQHYLKGDTESVKSFITACKKACGEKILLKVILETGALQKPEIIARASRDAILAGADFIKTSTGKIPLGATLEAAAIMLQTIHDLKLNRAVGFKASGGIRTLEQAKEYYFLAEKIMGKNWISPQTFRLGTSQLVADILNHF